MAKMLGQDVVTTLEFEQAKADIALAVDAATKNALKTLEPRIALLEAQKRTFVFVSFGLLALAITVCAYVAMKL